ncbi:MAG: protein-tyrosine-phosphatase [Alphaproteobacteria bacterium]|nr:MAG: protein-tyrosine-phosphatase [Alphaproteobacteria bacterium]
MTATQEKQSRFDLATPQGRRRARADLIWADHGFLRSRFSNFHWIEEGVMARANQPSPEAVARYAEMGVKTILNLRGPSSTGYYALEREACAEHGIAMIDARMHSREPPSLEQVRRAKDLFETIQYPALMHCKSGADRAGVMAVLYAHFQMGLPIEQAVEQLSLKYLHVKQGKTGVIDYFFDTYVEAARESGKPFMQWVEQDYDKPKVRADFKAEWWANILVDKILRRE